MTVICACDVQGVISLSCSRDLLSLPSFASYQTVKMNGQRLIRLKSIFCSNGRSALLAAALPRIRDRQPDESHEIPACRYLITR